jgi:two-component system cell cycle response regulator CtrA
MSDQLREDYIAALEAENDALRAKVADMERMFGFRNSVPYIFGLTTSEGKVLSLLIERADANKHQLLTAVMADRVQEEEPEMKIIDVYICKIRNKLKPFGIESETMWGRGYRLPSAEKAKIASYLEQQVA